MLEKPHERGRNQIRQGDKRSYKVRSSKVGLNIHRLRDKERK